MTKSKHTMKTYQKFCSSQPIIDWCAKCGSKEITFTCVACEHSWSSFETKSRDTSERRQVEEHCGHDTVIFMSPDTAEKHDSFVPDCQMCPKTNSSVSKQGADASAQSVHWVAVSGERFSTTSGKVSIQVKDSADSLGHKSYFKMTTMPSETPTDRHSIVSAANYSFNDRSDMSGDDAADGGITALPVTQLNVVTSVPKNPYLINSIMASPTHPNLSQIGLSLLSTQMVLENLAVSTACRLIHNEGNVSEREAENMLPLPVVVKGEKENRTSAQIDELHENSNKHPENVQSLHQEQHKEKDSRISCRLKVMRQPRTVSQSQQQAETSQKVQRPFLCEICGFANLTKVAFQRHLMTHTGEKPFLCQQCGDSFKDAWGLKKHVSKIHSRNKLYKCRICTDVFLSPRCLHLHLETVHSDRKTYRCQVCGKALATAKSLRRHKRIHTGEKPYECPHCDRAFNNSSGRVAHMKLHQDPNSVLYIPSVTKPS
ncbi:zinc finger protein OZF-like isoform X2 [Pomacea canaliculata]|uniref:zinc finger protein OZF-like isoform X2 n=1 Tax=Pomacea canaliculata TaxID=400727 RepID=UPI000D7328D8|nr:zinc finger protein OZF-like isoform X2 [Pomacea canaliculata]